MGAHVLWTYARDDNLGMGDKGEERFEVRRDIRVATPAYSGRMLQYPQDSGNSDRKQTKTSKIRMDQRQGNLSANNYPPNSTGPIVAVAQMHCKHFAEDHIPREYLSIFERNPAFNQIQ